MIKKNIKVHKLKVMEDQLRIKKNEFVVFVIKNIHIDKAYSSTKRENIKVIIFIV